MPNKAKRHAVQMAKPTDQQRQMMAKLASDAAEFYSHLEISDGHPILTGYRRDQSPPIIVPLRSGRAAEPDPNTVDWLSALLAKHGCDVATLMYPIELHPVDEEPAPDAPERFGILLEVQARGRPTFSQILHLTHREDGKNFFTPPAPVRGTNFGVIYPDLLNLQQD